THIIEFSVFGHSKRLLSYFLPFLSFPSWSTPKKKFDTRTHTHTHTTHTYTTHLSDPFTKNTNRPQETKASLFNRHNFRSIPPFSLSGTTAVRTRLDQLIPHRPRHYRYYRQ